MDEPETTNNITNGAEQSPNCELPEKITGDGRDEQGRWVKGFSGNPDGAKPQTEEEKEARRIRKEVEEKIKEEYKNGIIKELPQISPALLAKGKAGDVQAIKEIHSLIFGNKTVMVGGDKDEPAVKIEGINYIIPNANNSAADNKTASSV